MSVKDPRFPSRIHDICPKYRPLFRIQGFCTFKLGIAFIDYGRAILLQACVQDWYCESDACNERARVGYAHKDPTPHIRKPLNVFPLLSFLSSTFQININLTSTVGIGLGKSSYSASSHRESFLSSLVSAGPAYLYTGNTSNP